MTSVALFFFLIVIPIWSVATVIIRGIEASAGSEDDQELIESVSDISARITTLEDVMMRDKAGLKNGVP